MLCKFTGVSFDGVTAVVPERVINIEDELEFFDNNPKKLARAQKIVGYGTRHVVDTGVTALDLCEEAARRLINGMQLNPENIDTLIVVNQSPDYLLPSGSCIVHGRLDLPKSCATFDINLGCSGYVHGLWLAHSLIASGASKKLLLLAGDVSSQHSDPKNRLVNPLFGDAGTATLLSATQDGRNAWFSLGSDGKNWQKIVIPAGGARLPMGEDIINNTLTDEAGNVYKLNHTIIDGLPVFDFSINEVPQSITELLSYAGKNLDTIDHIALHQANKQIVQGIATALNIPQSKYSWATFSKYGNQSTASVACSLCTDLQEQMPQNDLTLVLSAFGVGLSWASAVIETKQAYNGGVNIFKTPANLPSREQQIAFWQKQFLAKGQN